MGYFGSQIHSWASFIASVYCIKYDLFNDEYPYAYENKSIYTFNGIFQQVHSDEELWTNTIVDNDIRCERNKLLALKCFEGKEVLLTRNFFDDDVDFECIAKAKKK